MTVAALVLVLEARQPSPSRPRRERPGEGDRATVPQRFVSHWPWAATVVSVATEHLLLARGRQSTARTP